MPKKAKPNGYVLYCEDQKARMRREGRWDGSLPQLIELCRPGWQQLSDAEKDMYKERARQEKASATVARQLWAPDDETARKKDTRLDGARERISDRVDPFELERAHRAKQREAVKSRWGPGKAVTLEVFYIIDFLPLMEVHTNEWLPAELSIAKYSLADGIIDLLHIFVHPGELPLGTLGQAIHECEATHKLPHMDTDEFTYETNYRSVWRKLLSFISKDTSRLPVLYTTAGNGLCVDFLLNLLAGWADEPNRLAQKLFQLEGLFEDLSNVACQVCSEVDAYEPVSFADAADRLNVTEFDYEESTCCTYHTKNDCNVCAVGNVRRWCYCLSGDLCDIFDIELTASHLPMVSETSSFVTRSFTEVSNSHHRPSAFPQHARHTVADILPSLARQGNAGQEPVGGQDEAYDGWKSVSSHRKAAKPGGYGQSKPGINGCGGIGRGYGRGGGRTNVSSPGHHRGGHGSYTQSQAQVTQGSSGQTVNTATSGISALSVSGAASPDRKGRGLGRGQALGLQAKAEPAIGRGRSLPVEGVHSATHVNPLPQHSWAASVSSITSRSSANTTEEQFPSLIAIRPALAEASAVVDPSLESQAGKSWAGLFSQPTSEQVRQTGSRGPPPGFGRSVGHAPAVGAVSQVGAKSQAGGFGRGSTSSMESTVSSNPWQGGLSRGRARGLVSHQPLRKPHGLSPMLQLTNEQRYQ